MCNIYRCVWGLLGIFIFSGSNKKYFISVNHTLVYIFGVFDYSLDTALRVKSTFNVLDLPLTKLIKMLNACVYKLIKIPIANQLWTGLLFYSLRFVFRRAPNWVTDVLKLHVEIVFAILLYYLFFTVERTETVFLGTEYFEGMLSSFFSLSRVISFSYIFFFISFQHIFLPARIIDIN